MKDIQVTILVLLFICILYTKNNAQNPFPQTSIYKSLNITSIVRSSSSTASAEPNTIATDLSFQLNSNGHIIKKVIFPGSKFERVEYKIYKADSILIEEGKWGLRKKKLGSKRLFEYDDHNRLIEDLFYVSGNWRSTKKYEYSGNTKNIKYHTKAYQKSKDTCEYMYNNSRLDRVDCVKYTEMINELDDSLRFDIINNTTTYSYDKVGKLIQESKKSDKGSEVIKEYGYQTPTSPRNLKRIEIIRSNGRYRSIEEFEYDNLARLISSIEKTFSPHQNTKTITHNYEYNGSGLLVEKKTRIMETIENGEVKTSILKFYFEYF